MHLLLKILYLIILLILNLLQLLLVYFMKFNLKCRYYLRYMDDFLVFGNDKRTVQNIKNEIRKFLQNKLNLILHEGKSQIYNTDKGIKFLGFKLFNRYRRLSSDNLRRFKKRLKKSINSLESGCYQEVEKFRVSLRCWVARPWPRTRPPSGGPTPWLPPRSAG